MTAIQQPQPPESNGWYKEGIILKPVLMTRDPAPRSLLELTTCQCRRSMCRANCSCPGTGLLRTEPCSCMADEEACENSHRTPLYFDSDSEDSDND